MPIESLRGWAVQCLVTDKSNTTFIMISEDLPSHADVMAAARGTGIDVAEVLSVQRSVPLALVTPDNDTP